MSKPGYFLSEDAAAGAGAGAGAGALSLPVVESLLDFESLLFVLPSLVGLGLALP